MSSQDALVGTWRLVSWESVAADGAIQRPFGDDPEGILVYTADGTMITTIGRSRRAPISGADVVGGPAAERLAAAESFIAYSARYRYDGRDVIHTVEMSLFPNWVGSRQVRHVELSGDGARLVLTADPMQVRGSLATQRLVWSRSTA